MEKPFICQNINYCSKSDSSLPKEQKSLKKKSQMINIYLKCKNVYQGHFYPPPLG